MNPVEVLFYSIGAMIGIIALARGYRMELGSTLIILVAIFVLTFFEDEMLGVFNRASDLFFGPRSGDDWMRQLFYMLVFQVVFVVIVFMGYAGRTLEFPGTQAPPPQGTLLTLALGFLNGYLIAGTLWYYLDRFNYPVQQLGLICLPLTTTGQELVQVLPQRVFESPTYWMLPVAALLILRVRG